ncbi:MAG TPA: 2-octaprenyl-6-methoxyphenyl hydroxylase [Steroidobacteraceae bacterium]|nr:2-octaprenyl-6-methoxyphenyl hydroxylase [Steroidobacteraceae bacterium]
MQAQPFDIAIVGGGMVGASLAVALAPLGLKVSLVEAVVHDSASQPSFDERTTALSNGSRRILETLGVWPGVAGQATPIRKIHVSDQGRFGFARIDAAEQGLAAMGYVVPNRALGAALWSRVQASSNVHISCPAQVSRITATPRAVDLEVAGTSETARIETKLVVAADGAQSAVRSALGVESESRDYQQTAVITTVLPQRFHDHVAFERFTGSGPLALLPLEGGRCTLVLTLNRPTADAAMGWSDAEFLAEVQRRFGFRLGRFLQVGRRVAYPLALTRAARTSADRCAIIGNAAQGLHPVAGMGFNLGLRDVASLAELIAEHRHEPNFDAGSAGLLAEYDAWRAADRGGVIAFTDSLVRMFANPLGVVRRLRNVGLLAFDLFPPAKAALSRLSTGAAGRTRIPKLARGVALQ